MTLGLTAMAGTQPGWSEPVPTIGIDELRRGQKGYGLSVFAGTEPEFRPGVPRAVFRCVVFRLGVRAPLTSNCTQLVFGDEASGGFDVAVAVNPNSRVPDLRGALRDAGYEPGDGIAGVGRLDLRTRPSTAGGRSW